MPKKFIRKRLEGLVVETLAAPKRSAGPRPPSRSPCLGAQVVPAVPYDGEVFPVERRPIYERALQAEQPDLGPEPRWDSTWATSQSRQYEPCSSCAGVRLRTMPNEGVV